MSESDYVDNELFTYSKGVDGDLEKLDLQLVSSYKQ